jgi:SAM-dependent methyltransferase
MTGGTAAAYGDRHAPVYDRLYGERFSSDLAVAALASAADGGRLLELGSGTGRLAIPLVQRGEPVDGIEASTAMIGRMRERPGGDRVRTFQVDLDSFQLPRHDYAVAVCAVSTMFMLPSMQAQTRCLTAAARHLRVGGQLFIEAFRPDSSRFDVHGRRTEDRAASDGRTHVVHSAHDPAAQTIAIRHVLGNEDPERVAHTYDMTLTYATEAQLDAMAAAAGLTLVDRWHDWTGFPVCANSTDPIGIYRR